MKTKIEVKNKEETALIRDGLRDPVVLAFVKIQGALSRLTTKRARVRVMKFVEDHFSESEQAK
jgi:hypothetical protein